MIGTTGVMFFFFFFFFQFPDEASVAHIPMQIFDLTGYYFAVISSNV
jgi:hypothetical protein